MPYGRRMNQMRRVQLKEFLTNEQIELAMRLRKADAICEEIIKPNLLEINRKLGQENHPMYLAYACEYACNMYQQKPEMEEFELYSGID
jgi:hypothetical protein